MKRIDEEYVKAGEDPNTPPSASGPGKKPISDTMVPSPPELDTPASVMSARKNPPVRRESLATVEGNDTENTKDTVTLQMPGPTSETVQSSNPASVSLLQNAPKV
jgi:hypothetical protein